MMLDPIYLPVTDPAEVRQLLKAFPLVVDAGKFVDFALGFPRRYLVQTPRLELVKHFLLAEALGSRNVITSLAQDDEKWRLSVLTRDRSFLFSLISGTLSCWDMHILSAEAFANAHAVVLDTLLFRDPVRHFVTPAERQRFQTMLEEIVAGTVALEPLLAQRWPDIAGWERQRLDLNVDNDSYPLGSVLGLRCRDRFGLLYLVSRHLAQLGISIDMAFIRTQDDQADDEFYVTRQGRKLLPEEVEALKQDFADFPMARFSS